MGLVNPGSPFSNSYCSGSSKEYLIWPVPLRGVAMLLFDHLDEHPICTLSSPIGSPSGMEHSWLICFCFNNLDMYSAKVLYPSSVWVSFGNKGSL